MIEYTKMEGLGSFELAEVKKYAEKAYKRVKRNFKDASMRVDVNVYDSEGSKKKYSAHITVRAPSLVAAVRQAGWDFHRVLNRVFDNLDRRMEKVAKRESTKHRKKKFTRD